MDFYNEPLYRKDKKTGRNDPCPCGSGKKYKKCCMESDQYAPDAYISAHEYNFKQKANDQEQLSAKDIWGLDPFELQQLKMEELNATQLIAAMRKSIMLDYQTLAISFIKELRKYFIANNGTMHVKETKIKLGVKKITMGDDDEKFDDFLHELVMNLEMSDKKEMVEQVINLYFDQSSYEYNYALFLIALYRKDPQQILDHIEKLAIGGIENLEHLTSLYFTLKNDYPGLALMAFRSVIAAFPNNNFDIELMAYDFDEFDEDPSMDTYEILRDFFDEDDEKDLEQLQIMKKMKQELQKARKESAQQQKKVEKLKKQQNEINIPQKKESLKENETDQPDLMDQIIQGRRKIENLQDIIKNKQEAIKELKSRIPLNNTEDTDSGQMDKEECNEIDFDISAHVMPKILIPEYSKEFIKSLETEDTVIARKALASVTAFAINDLKTLKQTKKLKALENYYSIRIGIHHRLIIEYTQDRPPKAQYLIHRKDLEKLIKKIQPTQ
ncbi:MAG: SEC-C metal-binding domain-containing protein [Spirochaetaceae bacterium]|nr:SEC-C metal-binding domain-containing protein [Spirochaetaceae bacterium]